jgi:hypothetical protein
MFIKEVKCAEAKAVYGLLCMYGIHKKKSFNERMPFIYG